MNKTIFFCISIFFFSFLVSCDEFVSSIPNYRVNKTRIEHFFEKMKSFGFDELTRGNRRVAYSSFDKDARNYLINYMKTEMNLAVEIDTAGNIFGEFIK